MMATAEMTECVEQVGETAGQIWHELVRSGPLSLAKLAKQIDAPRDLVMMAVGWLAREDKVCIEEESRTRIVSLR
jgi:hypothetical protein